MGGVRERVYAMGGRILHAVCILIYWTREFNPNRSIHSIRAPSIGPSVKKLTVHDRETSWQQGNDPWILMSRYLDNAPYAAHAFKGRTYYENILKFTGSIEVTHFTAANSNVYNFSKVMIKQIISAEEWGMIPQRGRGGYSQRGRGRGPNNILVQHGKHRLIASNIAESSASSSIPRSNDPLYGEFMEFLKNKKGNNPSYANALNEEENKDLQEYHQSPYKEKIIFLEY
nr:hypothetical protein [Tanacetum cinerariifolium]